MQIALKFGKPGYIDHPYTVAMHKLVEIKKISGTSRSRSEEKIRQKLESYLTKLNMTFAEYQALEREAGEQFTRNGTGEIIIPPKKILSCLVNANDEAPSRMRIRNIRNGVAASNFHTGKYEKDGTWERFVVVTGGSAMKRLSNQRGYRSSEYICDFTATGTLDVSEGMVKPEALLELLTFAGTNIGIGASRKMGLDTMPGCWGRFQVIS